MVLCSEAEERLGEQTGGQAGVKGRKYLSGVELERGLVGWERADGWVDGGGRDRCDEAVGGRGAAAMGETDTGGAYRVQVDGQFGSGDDADAEMVS